MPVTIITYSRKFQVQPYENEEFTLTHTLESGEEPLRVIEALKNLTLAHRSPVKEANRK